MADEQVVEQQESTPEQAKADFAAGFAKVNGGEAPKVEAETVAATEDTKPDEKAAETPPDPWKDVPEVVRKALRTTEERVESIGKTMGEVRGSIGGIKSQLTTALEAAKAVEKQGGEAPTQAQIQQASVSSERMKRLKEDFPEFAEEIESQAQAHAKELAAVKAAIPKPVDVVALEAKWKQESKQAADTAAAEGRQLARIDVAHDGWEETVMTPDFKGWFKAAPPELQALRSSEKASDVIRVLDAYTAHKKDAEAKAQAKADQDKRLKSAITPKGVPAASTTNLTPKQLFAKGFNNVHGGG